MQFICTHCWGRRIIRSNLYRILLDQFREVVHQSVRRPQGCLLNEKCMQTIFRSQWTYLDLLLTFSKLISNILRSATTQKSMLSKKIPVGIRSRDLHGMRRIAALLPVGHQQTYMP